MLGWAGRFPPVQQDQQDHYQVLLWGGVLTLPVQQRSHPIRRKQRGRSGQQHAQQRQERHPEANGCTADRRCRDVQKQDHTHKDERDHLELLGSRSWHGRVGNHLPCPRILKIIRLNK